MRFLSRFGWRVSVHEENAYAAFALEGDCAGCHTARYAGANNYYVPVFGQILHDVRSLSWTLEHALAFCPRTPPISGISLISSPARAGFRNGEIPCNVIQPKRRREKATFHWLVAQGDAGPILAGDLRARHTGRRCRLGDSARVQLVSVLADVAGCEFDPDR